MCKVALFNRSFYENNPEFVSRLLHSLVKECGGDGNGLGMLYLNNEVSITRGATLSVDEIMTECAISLWDERELPEWYVFHTRKATTAPLGRDDLCQPFYDRKTQLAMAHVGTVHAVDIWSIDGEAVSDGRMLFELGSKYSTDPLVDFYRSDGGTFAGFYKGVPYVVSCWGGLHSLGNVEDNAICFHTSGRLRTPDNCWEVSLKPGVYLTTDVLNSHSFRKVYGFRSDRWLSDDWYSKKYAEQDQEQAEEFQP